jgi:hypothetical protein
MNNKPSLIRSSKRKINWYLRISQEKSLRIIRLRRKEVSRMQVYSRVGLEDKITNRKAKLMRMRHLLQGYKKWS